MMLVAKKCHEASAPYFMENSLLGSANVSRTRWMMNISMSGVFSVARGDGGD